MKLRLNDKQVVHCKTEEEAIQCCQLAKGMGLTWCSGGSYDETNWQMRKEYMCYEFSSGTHAGLGYMEELNYQILTAQDFITMHSEPFMGYFKCDVENCTQITKILEYLGGRDAGLVWDDVCAFISKNGGIYSYSDEKDVISVGYHKCNLDHYLHLIDHNPDTRKMVEESADTDKLKAQIEKLKEESNHWKSFYEQLTIEATAFAKERNELREEVKELKNKADKWDAVPQVLCMRGDRDRPDEVENIFLENGFETNNLSFSHKDVIYFGAQDNKQVEALSINKFTEWLLSTHLITELPPLEEKEEVEEFWLKLTDFYITRYTDEEGDDDMWELEQYMGEYLHPESDKMRTYLPFTAETEPLIGTTDEPSKKYKFMGCRKYYE